MTYDPKPLIDYLAKFGLDAGTISATEWNDQGYFTFHGDPLTRCLAMDGNYSPFGCWHLWPEGLDVNVVRQLSAGIEAVL